MATLPESIFSFSDSNGDIIVSRECQNCRTCQNFIRVFEIAIDERMKEVV